MPLELEEELVDEDRLADHGRVEVEHHVTDVQQQLRVPRERRVAHEELEQRHEVGLGPLLHRGLEACVLGCIDRAIRPWCVAEKEARLRRIIMESAKKATKKKALFSGRTTCLCVTIILLLNKSIQQMCFPKMS